MPVLYVILMILLLANNELKENNFTELDQNKATFAYKYGLNNAFKLNKVLDVVDSVCADFILKQIANNSFPESRDLLCAAYWEMGNRGDTAIVRLLLEKYFSAQNMDSTSAEYGNIQWKLGHPEIIDFNSIEFCSRVLIPLYLEYREKFNYNLCKIVKAHIRASLYAVYSHSVDIKYTNIYLMRTFNMCLLGEALNNSSAIKEGDRLIEEWINFTNKNGISEFDSPIYFATDLDNLYLGCRYIKSESVVKKLKKIINFFWIDIHSNFFTPARKIAGTHIRDYDFIYGKGGLDIYLYLSGLKDELERNQVDMSKCFLFEISKIVSFYSNRFSRGTELTDLYILQKFVPNLKELKTTYVSPYYMLSSCESSYGKQDKIITIDLLYKNYPTISILADKYDSPWGEIIHKDQGGHLKPEHMELQPILIQKKNFILAFLHPVVEIENKKNIALTIILPKDLDILTVDGEEIAISDDFDINIAEYPVISLIKGSTYVIFKIFYVNNLNDKLSRNVIQTDLKGSDKKVFRFTHYFGYQDFSNKSFIKPIIGLLILVDKVKNKEEYEKMIRNIQNSDLFVNETLANILVSTKFKGENIKLGIIKDAFQPDFKNINTNTDKTPILSINEIKYYIN